MTNEKALELLKNNQERRIASTYVAIKRLSIEALEKQIPKMVINKDKFYDYCECPTCNGVATDSVGCVYKWCRKCGQRLKWSEENDETKRNEPSTSEHDDVSEGR